MVDIYGIGNLLIDIVTQVTDKELASLELHKGTMHLTDEAERARLLDFLTKKEVTYSCGGDCPNTMIALASFGVEACLAGKVGDDEFGRIYLGQLGELPIRSEVKVGQGSTGSSIILVSPDSERTMNTHLGINRDFSFEDVSPAVLDEARFLYFTGYLWDTDLQKDAILRTLAIARAQGCTIAFDLADPFAVSRNRDEFLRIVADYVDIAFANREEARILFGTDDVRVAVERLSALTRIAVVKNGAAGSLVMAGKKRRERARRAPLDSRVRAGSHRHHRGGGHVRGRLPLRARPPVAPFQGRGVRLLPCLTDHRPARRAVHRGEKGRGRRGGPLRRMGLHPLARWGPMPPSPAHPCLYGREASVTPTFIFLPLR